MTDSKMTGNLIGYLWKVPLSALAFAVGLVMSRIVFQLFVSPPRLPTQAPESIAIYYLLIGSVFLAAGLVPTAVGLRGRFWQRWLVFAAFLFVGFGINSTVETAIFSTATGVLKMIPVLLLPCVGFAAVAVAVFNPAGDGHSAPYLLSRFLSQRKAGQWLLRFAAALLAFPLVYFIFGLIVMPIVTPVYEQGVSGLALPPVGVILGIQLLRSALFLITTVPVLLSWSGSRLHLILALGFAHFVFVGTYDTVLAYQIPTILLIVHSFEILADGMVYAWVVVKLLIPAGFFENKIARQVEQKS